MAGLQHGAYAKVAGRNRHLDFCWWAWGYWGMWAPTEALVTPSPRLGTVGHRTSGQTSRATRHVASLLMVMGGPGHTWAALQMVGSPQSAELWDAP